MSKQDRQGVRTPSDLERKYNFGQVFADQQTENSRQGDLISRLNQTLAQFMAYATGALETLGKDLDEAEVAISNLETATSSLGNRLSKTETDIFEHEQAILSLEERMATAEGNISGLNGTATSLGTRIGSVEGSITSLEERVSALENA